MAQPNFFESGGGRIFVSITDVTVKKAHSYTHNTCVLAKSWTEAVQKARELIKKRSQNHIVLVEMFIRPRLCKDCLKHTIPGVFNKAKYVTECLCRIEKNADCAVHKFK